MVEGDCFERSAEEEAADFVAAKLGSRRPRHGIVLGSGLEPESLGLSDPVSIEGIPHILRPSVEGHVSRWVLGRLSGVEVLVLGGRVHAYEGVELSRATLPIRVVAELACEGLILTNAAGGIDEKLVPGTLMRIRDHLDFLHRGPLVAPGPAGWVASSRRTYDHGWGQWLLRRASEQGMPLREGVYAACSGPSYETPAEVRMLGFCGASAVGMSTVPEAIMAREHGLRVLGVSLITNRAAGLGGRKLCHDEVLDAGREGAERLAKVVSTAVQYAGPGDEG